MLVHMQQITRRFGSALVLADVSLVANPGDRIGIVGANGAGKSTLLKIAAGVISSDEGQITYAPAIEMGYVPQTVKTEAGQTVADVLMAARQRVVRLEQQMHTLAEQMATTDGPEQAALLRTYGEVADRFERAGGYAWEHQIEQVLSGLGVGYLAPDRRLTTLSGGEKTRVALAGLLLRMPDLLLLDEPTNHLDVAAVAWLETFLVQQTGAALVVSHDRRFLNRVATRIAELDEHTHQLTCYGGNYTVYSEQKRRERHSWEAAYAQQQAEIAALRQQITRPPERLTTHRPRPDGDKLSFHFHGQRVQRAVSRYVRAAEQRLQRILADPLPRPPEPLQFQAAFAAASASGKVGALHQVSRAFADQPPVLAGLSLDLQANQRMLIVGENGAGKTTLLRILAGELAPDNGTVWWGEQIDIGYLPQEDTGHLEERSVLQVYREGRVGHEADLQAELLAWGLFVPEDIRKPVRQLSVGQRRKLQLARLLTKPVHVLLLDEPTNQLGLDLVEQLEQALDSFSGAVVAVSHDRQFIEQFRGERWRLDQGGLKPISSYTIENVPGMEGRSRR